MEISDKARAEAVDAMIRAYNAEFNHTNNAFRRPMRAALDALLAAGWTPPEHIADAISAAEERGRREGIEAAELRAAFEAGRDQAFSEAGARSMGLSFKRPDQAFADHIRALSSIPPQEADQ